jgi:hypothetical protein
MELTPTDLAYAAGVIDSDGYIGVQHSDYRVRVRKDSQTPTYSARIIVKQVEPQAVDLLRAMWGGYRGVQGPSAKRGRPLHAWEVHSAGAGRALEAMLPYLRIKREQAKNALEVCRLVRMGVRRFELPEIVDGEPMVTMAEAARRLRKDYGVVIQSVRKGNVPHIRSGPRKVLIPESYLTVWAARAHTPSRSPEVLAQLHACFLRGKELNRVGV